MPCYSPLSGWYSRHVNASGKRSVVFNPSHGFHDLPVTVPCGQCIGCRLERSRQWALRCMNEASLHDENCFITVTYDDDHIPALGSLRKADFQKFMKRLRKHFPERKVRYYHAGEYGDRTGRPHYHACLFGFDFPDKVAWSVRNGFPVWRSVVLETLWPFGQSEIGSVTFESAAYVARYIVKKVLGAGADEAYEVPDADGVVVQLEKEYTTMSRRPGIGKAWFDQFGGEVYPADGIPLRGKLVKPPRYYDVALEMIAPDVAASVCRARRRARKIDDETWERLAVREQVALAKLETFSPRVLE